MTRNKLTLHQRGVVLLLMLLILFVSGSSMLLGARNNHEAASLQHDAEVQRQLLQAKGALLSYAANTAALWNNTMGPGFFPCPDKDSTDGNPTPTATCNGNIPQIGRLPEYVNTTNEAYQLNNAYSGIDQQFWYVVAPRYIYDTATATNRRANYRTSTSYNNLRLTLDGNGPYVALLIAPGTALDTQDRANGQNDYTNYLDGQNGSDGFAFYTRYAANPALFNDKIIGITLDEYMKLVGTRVATEMFEQLSTYHSSFSRYPPSSSSSSTFRSQFDGSPIWLKRNTTHNQERWSNTSTSAGSSVINTNWIRCTDDDRGYLYFQGYNSVRWYFNADNNTFSRIDAGAPNPC